MRDRNLLRSLTTLLLTLFLSVNGAVVAGEGAQQALHSGVSELLHHDLHTDASHLAAADVSQVPGKSPSSTGLAGLHDCHHHGCHTHSPMAGDSTPSLPVRDAMICSPAPRALPCPTSLTSRPPVPPPDRSGTV